MRTTQDLPASPRASAPDPTLPSVLAVVVTHNGRPWLRDCLVSLNTQTYRALDVLVVDDASPDYRRPPHLKRVAKRHLRRRRWGYLRTPRPFGFGGAINWALARARTDADFFLFIHDDAALTPESVERMVARAVGDAATAIVGPKIVSWDDPARLEEIGMAVDRFGYPYKGLEENEIDIGQHDDSSEVFFVTSTCMLVRANLFRQLKGWDSTMRAFSEDLDLCWRARVLGHSVKFEPMAKARHAIALAKGQRKSKFLPQRYYIRRNRLRAMTKNVSAIRLVALFPLFLLLTLAEMLGFIVLRQPREILNLARALGWNFIRLPETFAARTRVQLNRRVSDRRLQRLMIRETSRLRFYIQYQAARLEEAWGRRAEFVAARSTEARALGRRMRGRPTLILLGSFIAFVLAFRGYIWGPAAAVGELLPFPDRPTGLWRTFFSPWQGAGLGQPGPTSPSLLPLGALPLLSLGATGTAQKLMMLALGAIAFWGAYRLTSDIVDRWGRIAAGAAYVAGTLGYAGVRSGALTALAFGAAAPFVLHSLLRLSGWIRPAGWLPGREIAKLAAGAGISAAFVPGSLVFYFIAAVVLAASREILVVRGRAIRSLIPQTVGLILGWVLLLPWSASWWEQGAPLERLRGDGTWRFFAAQFDGHGMASVLVGQTPDGPALFGLALPLLGIVAVGVGEGQRRRVAIALWTVIAASGVLISLMATGTIRPVVASPTEAGVLPALAFAGLAGVAVGTFRADLPRRGFGLVQGLAVTGLAVSAFLIAAGLGPAVWRGEWEPGSTRPIEPRVLNEIHGLLDAEAEASEVSFHVLWVGEQWVPGAPSAARPLHNRVVTGPRGPALTDLFEYASGEGEAELDRIVESVQSGATDRAGGLLGAFNIRFVILQRGPTEKQWLEQRDLGAIRRHGEYLLFENFSQLALPGVYEEVPRYARALAARDPRLTAGALDSSPEPLETETGSHYFLNDVVGPGVVYLPESSDERWTATLQDRELDRIDAGWANAFAVPAGASGSLTVAYDRPGSHLIVWIVVGLAWVVVLGAASSTRRIMPRAT